MATVHETCLQNKPCKRRTSSQHLISNFGLSTADLNTVLMLLSDQYSTVYLQEIITHLDTIYVIGVEYMYIRKPEVVEWIQKN
jgi:2-oxoglutarate dehydrogenase E1 component